MNVCSKATLKKFGTANCDAVVQRLAEADDKKLTKDELKEKFEFIKECKVAINTSFELKDTLCAQNIKKHTYYGFVLQGKTSGTLTADDLTEAGNTLCGMDSAAPDRMDADALEKIAPILQKCNLDPSTRQKIASNIVSKMSL